MTENVYIIESNDILTDEDIHRLAILGQNIMATLSCDINGKGFPCHTDRMESIKLMKEYISIHKE